MPCPGTNCPERRKGDLGQNLVELTTHKGQAEEEDLQGSKWELQEKWEKSREAKTKTCF